MKTIIASFILAISASLQAQLIHFEDFYPNEFAHTTDLSLFGNQLSNYHSDFDEGLNLFLVSSINYNNISGGLMIAGFGNEGKLRYTKDITNEVLAMLPDNIILSNFLNYGVASAGDLNDDGIDDLVVGIPAHKDFKREDKLAFIFMNINFSPDSIKVISASELGYKKQYEFGNQVNNIGDWDKNGYDDLAISLSGFENKHGLDNYMGAIVILFLGKDGEIINTKKILNQDTEVSSIAWGFGTSILGTEDFNQDGISDLIIGTPEGFGNGVVDIYYLDNEQNITSTARIDKRNLSSNIFGGNDHFGQAISSLGDLNNDGIPELLVSMHWSKRDKKHAGKLISISLDKEGNVIDHAQVFDNKKEDDYLITDDHLGRDVIILNDMNKDGINEILVSVDDDRNNYKGKLRLIYTDHSYLLGSTSIVNNADKAIHLDIYPNPTSDVLNLKSNNQINNRYKIVNTAGRNVMTGLIDESLKIQIDQLPSGNYFLAIIDKQQNESFVKFIKH